MPSIPEHTTPPSAPSETYIIPAYEGEQLVIPGSKSVFRIVASEQQTDDTISVFSSGGALADAPGFHHHNEAHDIFIVTKGSLRLWNGDKCRIMTAGDFASIPPGIIHNPQLLGPITETYGVIHPASWLDFFRYVSDLPADPFVLYPETDTRNLLQHLIPKVMAAHGKYDVHFHKDHVGCKVGEWEDADERLPDGTEPYYLKADRGPRYVLGSVLARPFCTTKQTAGKFAIASIEGSNLHKPSSNVFSQKLSFPNTHHVFAVMEGKVEVRVGDFGPKVVTTGETVFVRKGAPFSFAFLSRYAKFWSFASGNGIEKVVIDAGMELKEYTVPGVPNEIDQGKVESALKSTGAKNA